VTSASTHCQPFIRDVTGLFAVALLGICQLACFVTADVTQGPIFGVALESPLLGDRAKAWSVLGVGLSSIWSRL